MPPCVPTFLRLPPGPSGSTSLTPSPLYPPVACSPLIGALTRAMFSAPSRVLLSWEDARESHLQDFLSTPFEQKGVCDEWCVDDGQCLVRPMLFDRWLRALDSALASFGATRGRIALGNAKSSARLLCPPERFHEFSGWDTAYVRDTVVVLSPDAGTTALGSAFGTREQINARAWESVRACDELRSAINGVDHAPTELVLTRQCADVSKLMYHMRINGDILDHDLLASFDGQLRASVSNSLSGDLPDHSWWQATTGVTVGGLGLRTGRDRGSAGLRGEPHLISSPRGHHGGSPLRSHWGLSPNDHGRV